MDTYYYNIIVLFYHTVVCAFFVVCLSREESGKKIREKVKFEV